MSSIKSNLKSTVRNLLGASTALVSVTSEVLLDASTLAVSGVSQVMPVAKELAVSPLSAYQGALMQGGMDEEEAKAKAFAVLDKDVATAVRDGSIKSGMLLSQLFEGWDEEETKKKAA